MNIPVRKEIHDILKHEETATLRDLVEWYKRVVKGLPFVPTRLELDYINGRWAGLVSDLANKEKVPAGWLSYSLNNLATAELEAVKMVYSELGLGREEDK